MRRGKVRGAKRCRYRLVHAAGTQATRGFCIEQGLPVWPVSDFQPRIGRPPDMALMTDQRLMGQRVDAVEARKFEVEPFAQAKQPQSSGEVDVGQRCQVASP